MRDEDISEIVKILKKVTKTFAVPSVTEIGAKHNPFKVLISTIISLRTKDIVTSKASLALFKKASTPKNISKLSETEVETLIYPAGFYKTKAKNIKKICEILLEKYGGIVPNDIEKLLALPGVGRKTANLVLTLGFGSPGICVDIHVHRIFNRLGYVSTKTPDETEVVLRKKLPKKYWIVINDLLVMYGQNLCRPISPFCSKCKIKKYCSRINIDTHR